MHGNRPLAQSLDLSASLRRDAESPVLPRRDGRFANAKSGCQRGPAKAVDECGESGHANQFSMAELAWQAKALVTLNHVWPRLRDTGSMSIAWQDKAKRLMRAQDVPQKTLVEALSVTKGTVSNWLSGRHQPSVAQLRKIAKVLGVTLSELVEDDDSWARSQFELDMLRQARSVPAEQQERAAQLVKAVLATLAPPPDQPDKN